ncbi:MAG: hypothetical protein ACNA78_06460 [Balneolaceae bacterium]
MESAKLILELLQIDETIPLTEKEMAHELTVTFKPPSNESERLNRFSQALRSALLHSGAAIIPYNDALNDDGKVASGIVVIEQAEEDVQNLAMRSVSTLYHNPIITLIDQQPPIRQNPTLQETLDTIIGVLTYNLSHLPVFVEPDRWTICTMNGAIIRCGNWTSPEEDVLHALVPKLSAQVKPPDKELIRYREGVLDAVADGYEPYINEFMDAAAIWKANGLMLAHTSLDSISYRDDFHRRIVARYLDNRTGMSYGFLAQQLPASWERAIPLEEAKPSVRSAGLGPWQFTEIDGTTHARIPMFGRDWAVVIPDIWLLSTRSGCNKTDLNGATDILRFGLHKGSITIDTPKGVPAGSCNPSYDTYAILAHAVGNVIAASILAGTGSNSPFPDVLAKQGLSISHWHGYPDPSFPLEGYLLQGNGNPPVSCSTPQSAAYAFAGKLRALENRGPELPNYRGEIHVEPHHGTNITGTLTLSETAAWVDRMHRHRKSEQSLSEVL